MPKWDVLLCEVGPFTIFFLSQFLHFSHWRNFQHANSIKSFCKFQILRLSWSMNFVLRFAASLTLERAHTIRFLWLCDSLVTFLLPKHKKTACRNLTCILFIALILCASTLVLDIPKIFTHNFGGYYSRYY